MFVSDPNNTAHYGESLNGVFGVDELDKVIRTPGDLQRAIINPTETVNGQQVGEIFKTVDLTQFNLTDKDAGFDDRLDQPDYANDIIFGGLGNDFLMMFHAPVPESELPALARRLCDRHRGVGADGLLIAESPPADAESTTRYGATMLLFNADSSRAEMSGNGIRCFAQAAFCDTTRIG